MTSVLPRLIDLAGFPVRRLLPTRAVRSVGPWVFFDHMGPHTFRVGGGADVIPHPHIGLATVTYLFSGSIVHRDTLGSIQPIEPGAINLMIAGSGIAHSERTSPDRRAAPHQMHGLQLWLGLPEQNEDDPPSFLHYDASEIPQQTVNGVDVRVMIGSALDLTSPVTTLSPTLYAEAELKPETALGLSGFRKSGNDELALYCVQGQLSVRGKTIEPNALAVFDSDESWESMTVEAGTGARVALMGGSTVGKRYMWWNFVSSRTDRIEQAKADWSAGRFGQVVEDIHERAPLPDADKHSRMKE